MVGPAGVGEERYVKPGEWMDYTIYFENATNATAAAQDVYVTLPKDAGLDWSSFELGEVVFGDNIDTGLSGAFDGVSSYALPGTNWSVRTEVTHSGTNVMWHLRIVDPTTADNYPVDAYAGFLPPNDPETHCGEGHLRYRVKVNEDVEIGTMIHASAIIHFDPLNGNDPIETDPAWWNTVGAVAEAMPVYRFYSKNYKGHFFTIDEDEMWTIRNTNRNWSFEGTAYMAYTNQVHGTVPLYRFYSKGYRGHFFTIDADEAETVKKNPNWKYEGIAYYVYPEEVEGAVPVFRFWSKGYRHHFYTTDEAEKDTLIATNPNWKYEGVAFYAMPAESGKKAMKKAAAAAGASAGAGTRPEGRIPGDGAGAPGGATVPDARFRESADPGPTVPDADALGCDGMETAAPWTLRTRDGAPIARDGATVIGEVLVETRDDAPDAAELESFAKSSETGRSGGASAPREPPGLRLVLPPGSWNALLWSAEEGVTAEEETSEDAFDFSLPASGVWHWLRVRGGEGEGEFPDAFSLWLRAVAD